MNAIFCIALSSLAIMPNAIRSLPLSWTPKGLWFLYHPLYMVSRPKSASSYSRTYRSDCESGHGCTELKKSWALPYNRPAGLGIPIFSPRQGRIKLCSCIRFRKRKDHCHKRSFCVNYLLMPDQLQRAKAYCPSNMRALPSLTGLC
jgi:hypothetical protein